MSVSVDGAEPQARTAEPRRESTVLIVDDDVDLHSMLASALSPSLRVQSALTVFDALAKWRAMQPDLLLLDLALEDGSGIEVLVEIRKTSEVPVVVVTGDSSAESSVLALRLGADDYIVKPFSLLEVQARIDAVLRRSSRAQETSSLSRFGELTIDTRARQVFVNDVLVHLTATEFDLIAYLSSQPRHAFTREQLLDAVWRSNSEWQTVATVTEHTRRLRTKLGPAAHHIATVYGRGYRFDP